MGHSLCVSINQRQKMLNMCPYLWLFTPALLPHSPPPHTLFILQTISADKGEASGFPAILIELVTLFSGNNSYFINRGLYTKHEQKINLGCK